MTAFFTWTVALILTTVTVFGQTTSKEVKTVKYAGKYSYGRDTVNNYGGNVTVYPETDTTVLFWIDIYSGNLGQMYNRLTIRNGKGFFSKHDELSCCKWIIAFDKDKLTISTTDKCYDCGFGGSIFADHEYKLIDKTVPKFFIDGHGHKIYFRETSPENYQR